MADTVTLELVEAMVSQLPPRDQLKLVAHIGEQLSAGLSATSTGERANEGKRHEREATAETLLAGLDSVAESIEGEFDSAEDLRLIREERANRL